MKDFAGRIAVITGGGTGMGRELARQLIAEGCNVAMCDISAANMAETTRLCEVAKLPQGLRVTTHVADVSSEQDLLRFRDEVSAQHQTDRIHLLFNNAGIGGGGSMIVNTRDQWERTFNICWGGVYLGTRTFLPMLMQADAGHIVNTSSVNGFWASIGPSVPHTAYSAAKFAVKGFTEALVGDLRLHAPHIKCSVVMPGHIGTAIRANSRRVQSATESDTLTADELQMLRDRIAREGGDPAAVSDADLQALMDERARMFLEEAPTTAAQAATIILDGVRQQKWRILVGDDAYAIDRQVRADPEQAYEMSFFEKVKAETGWRLALMPQAMPEGKDAPFDAHALVNDLNALLRLKTTVIGMKMFGTVAEMQAIPKIRRPTAIHTTDQIVSMGARLGWTVGITAEDLVGQQCRAVIGLAPQDDQWLAGKNYVGVWHGTAEDARKRQEALSVVPSGRYEALVVSPLASGRLNPPDICLVYATPGQMIILINGLQYTGYKKFEWGVVGETACADSWGRALKTGEPSLSLPCYAERRYGGVPDEEMLMALSPAHLAKAIVGMQALARNGLRYPIPPYGIQADVRAGMGVSYTKT